MDNSLIILVVIIFIMILCTFSNKNENFENDKSYQIVRVDDRTVGVEFMNIDYNTNPIIIKDKKTNFKYTGDKAFPDFVSTYILPDNIGNVQYNGKNYKGILIYSIISDRDPIYFITFDVNSQPIP